MRMYFNHDVAWRQLRDNGFVATLRGGKEKPGDVKARTVEIWRNKKDMGLRGTRRFIGQIRAGETDLLNEWVHASGFESWEEWMRAAVEMSGKGKLWRLFVVNIIVKEGAT